MKSTFVQNGDLLDYTPATAKTSGDIVHLGRIAGQVTNSVAANEAGALRVGGVIRITKAEATVFDTTAGAEVYYQSSDDTAVTDSTKPYLGVAVAGGADGDLYVDVLLNAPQASGVARVLRTRVTTAQVNAGLSLLPAIPGRKYRIHDAAAIAVGGAAATVTTVDLLATQSASSVKLVAFGQAALTQNTLLRAGASGGTILAGGASFVANDANTAVTIGKTGSDLATATHIDVLLTYTVE